VVSLVDENRTFVVNGLEMLNHTRNSGLRALIGANELSDERLTAYHIGFRLGPCLNASGRLESAKEAIQLLLEEDTEQALIQAETIKNINEERKEMTLQGVELAEEYLENSKEMKIFVIYLPGCHESLAGIIAGRIREEYHHPVFVLVNSEEEGILKGSGRSIEDYHMYEALRGCDDLLTKYGGHAMAAGLSMKAENLEAFTQRINEQCELEAAAFIPKVYIDVPMPISYVTEDLIGELENLAPFGKGNEKPVFAQKDVNLLSAKIMGKERNVIKLTMETSDGATGEGIYFEAQEMSDNLVNWFGQEEYDKLLHGWLNNIVLNIVYYPSVNEFNGNRTIQFQIKRYSMAAVREVL
jgi:single-stranded-DNA-specific exonuclease